MTAKDRPESNEDVLARLVQRQGLIIEALREERTLLVAAIRDDHKNAGCDAMGFGGGKPCWHQAAARKAGTYV